MRTASGVVHVLTDDQTATACPACEVLVLGAAAPHDPAARPALRRGTAEVRWHKVQYACREALCGRKAFTEQMAEVPAGAAGSHDDAALESEPLTGLPQFVGT